MTATSTQQVIEAKLLWRLGRQWRVGDRLPPIKDLARELGTGQSNTHEAVRQLAARGLLQSRQRRGTIVARLPQTPVSARPDGGVRGRVVAVVTFTPMTDPFVRQIAQAVTEDVIAGEGRAQPVDVGINEPVPLLNADAVVVINPAPPLMLSRHPWQPTVVVSTAWHVVSTLPIGVDAVGINDHQGGMIAGRTVAERGCTQVGYIGVSPDWNNLPSRRWDNTSSVRLSGFEAGLGHLLNEAWMLRVQGYSVVSGGKAFGQYMRLPQKPRTLFAACDDLAIGFCAAATAAGLRPGHDFQIIGFDGQERGLHLVEGGLTSVAVPAAEMGRRAAGLIRDRFAQPDRPDHRLQLTCSLRAGATLATSSSTGG